MYLTFAKTSNDNNILEFINPFQKYTNSKSDKNISKVIPKVNYLSNI